MSDDESDRPLTRRERRLREMAASGSAPIATEPVAEAEQEDDIVISPVNEDGTPRTRREMRALREQALAARASKREPQDAPHVEEEVSTEPGFDPRLAETQPFSPADLEEALEDETDESGEADAVSSADVATEPKIDPALSEEEFLPTAPSTDAVEGEPSDASGEEAKDEESAENDPDSDAGSTDSSDHTEDQPAQESSGYSFPDITPLDDNVSVFDDPSRIEVGGVANGDSAEDDADSDESGAGDDFDSLISRAVAQEGSPRTTNTSALILPNLPDNAGLSGPLGETGELYITGSIKMPKSLGETGGRAAVHDSADADALDELGFHTMGADPIEPVSAKRAVSSTGAHTPLVENQQTEKSKLPLVLILTGGGLLVAVAGLLTWGITSGMFG